MIGPTNEEQKIGHLAKDVDNQVDGPTTTAQQGRQAYGTPFWPDALQVQSPAHLPFEQGCLRWLLLSSTVEAMQGPG